MAAEISEITGSNHPVIAEDIDGDILNAVQHILIDLHDALRMLTEQGKLMAKHDAMLEEYRPLLERFAHPLAAGLAARKEKRQRHGR